MKTVLAAVLAGWLCVGCGMADYYKAVGDQNKITAAQLQAYLDRQADAFSKAMNAAAKTESPADDVAISMGYMYQMNMMYVIGSKQQQIQAPAQGPEYLRAASPILLTGFNSWLLGSVLGGGHGGGSPEINSGGGAVEYNYLYQKDSPYASASLAPDVIEIEPFVIDPVFVPESGAE